MPAALRPADPAATTADDLLGLKWVTGVPANRAAGIAPINAVVILSDPATGQPIAMLDGGPDHRPAHRRRLRRRGPAVRRRRGPGRPSSVPASRAGATPRCSPASLPGAELVIHDRHPDGRAAELADAVGRHDRLDGPRRGGRCRRRHHRRDLRPPRGSPVHDRPIGCGPTRWSCRSTTRRCAPRPWPATPRCS